MQILLRTQENGRKRVKCAGKGAKRGEHGDLQRVDVALQTTPPFGTL
jgi:hypothetical protein